MNWKRKFSFISDESMLNRKISLSYWNGFKKRNTNVLASKKGAKCDLNRSNWKTCSNFSQMHDNIGEEIL